MLGNYSLGLLVQAFIFGVVALITDVIWGYAGILTFASAAMFGVGAYSLGIVFVHIEPAPEMIALAVVIAMAVAGLLSALIAGVGVFYSLYSTVVAPSLVGMTLATNVLIWVILGGRATIIGPTISAILITVVTPMLSTTIPLYWQGLLGLIFVLVILFMPHDVLPAIWGGITALFGRKAEDKAQVQEAAATGYYEINPPA